MEIWKDCIYYEGKYQISNEGRVWSVKNQKYMSIQDNGKGYKFVTLQAKNGKGKREYIHRLVALAFIPNPDNLPQVNHKDGNKENNVVGNLEWCTESQNIQHAWDNGLRSKTEKQGEAARRNGKRCAKKILMDNSVLFNGVREASRETKIDRRSIQRVINGEWTHTNGHIFKEVIA